MRVIGLEGENALAAKARGQTVHQKADIGLLMDAGIEISDFTLGALHPAVGWSGVTRPTPKRKTDRSVR